MILHELVRTQNLFLEVFISAAGYYTLRSMFIGGTAAWLRENSRLARRKIYRLKIEKPQVVSELVAGVRVLLIDSLVAALILRFDLFQHGGDSWPVTLGTFIGFFVWTEIWFYVSHRLLHSKSLYFIHAQHHVAKVTTPLTAISFSVLERLILVVGVAALPAALSFFIPISFRIYIVYFSVNYALNTFGHWNIEIVPPAWVKSRLGSILNATTYHALHHARYNGHYGLFTPFLDRWFGSRFNDYLQVHQAAYEGHGLEKLNQKFAEEATA